MLAAYDVILAAPLLRSPVSILALAFRCNPLALTRRFPISAEVAVVSWPEPMVARGVLDYLA